MDSAAASGGLRVALLTPGPVSDQGWNGGAFAGLMRIKDSLGAKISHIQTKTPAEFDENFQLYGQQGYALDNRENEDHGRCIAAPIGGPDGRVIAALSLSGPVPRVTLVRARSLAEPLRLACREISSSLRSY